MRFLRTVPIAALAAMGCATLQTNGSTQRILVSSTPPAAEVFLDGQAVGVTPVEVVVSRRAEHVVRIEKDGFRPSEQTLRRSTSWWLLADVGVGTLVSIYALAHRQADGVNPHFGHTAGVAAGAAPVVLDYLTGAAFKFSSQVDAHLAQRAPGSRVREPERHRWPREPDRLRENLRRSLARGAATTVSRSLALWRAPPYGTLAALGRERRGQGLADLGVTGGGRWCGRVGAGGARSRWRRSASATFRYVCSPKPSTLLTMAAGSRSTSRRRSLTTATRADSPYSSRR